ncbi:hypothetical protein V4C53_45535 [Paraburkholderia azotifigens]|uniref:hypothetical protein n=1 Tax=Paraburkholderia azotifigens TaxID=2057004 RepID=UPI0031807810
MTIALLWLILPINWYSPVFSLEPATCGLFCFCTPSLPFRPVMKERYVRTDAALRDALTYNAQRGAGSSFAVLLSGAVPDDLLTGTDATAQAARIVRRLDSLPAFERALLIVAYAPHRIVCSCGRACCCGYTDNREWAEAMTLVLAETAPLFSGRAPHIRLRRALTENLLTHRKETAVSLAERYGVNRRTVTAHQAVLEPAGTRSQRGAFDMAFAHIDTLLREAGLVIDEGSDVPVSNGAPAGAMLAA